MPFKDIAPKTAEGEKIALLYKILFLSAFLSLVLLYRVAVSEQVNPVAMPLFLVLGVLIGIAVIAIPEARLQPFSAFSYAAILWLVGYVYRGVVLSTTPGAMANVWGTPEDHLVPAAWLSILGFVCFFLGYRSRVGPALGRWMPFVTFPSWTKMPTSKLMLKLYILYGVGWLGRLLLFSVGIFHRQQEILVDISLRSWISMLAQMAIFSVWAIMAIKNQRGDRLVTFLPWFFVEFIHGLIEGGRTVMARGVLIYFFTRSLYGPKAIKWSNVILVIALSFITVFPMLSMIRHSYYRTQDAQGRQGVDTAIDSVKRWDEEYRDSEFSTLQSGIYMRFAYIDPLLVVLDRVPSLYPFQQGATFLVHSFIAPIPRLFWKNKPMFNSGRKWSILFADDPNETEIGTYTYIGTISEAYFNYGYMGVLLLFVIGVWLRLHWSRYITYKQVDPVSVVRIPFLVSLTSPVAHLTSLFSGIWRQTFDMYFYTVLIFGIPRIVSRRSSMLKPKE